MRKRLIAVERLESIARTALLGGYGVYLPYDDGEHRRLFKLPLSGSCETPVAFELHARYSAEHLKTVKPITIIGASRCRKCGPCKQARQRMWIMRSHAEFIAAPCSVFGTFTMSPDEHWAIDASIEHGRYIDGQVARHPVRINQLSSEELFSKRVKVFGEHLQDYLKRLRTGTKDRRAKIRYLLVAEMHDGLQTSPEMRGRPHFHVLFHDMVGETLVKGSVNNALITGNDGEWTARKYKAGKQWRLGVFAKDDAWIRTEWKFGHTKFQYCENVWAASYLCKYLTKSSGARVRASQNYGYPERVYAPKETVVRKTTRKLTPSETVD